MLTRSVAANIRREVALRIATSFFVSSVLGGCLPMGMPELPSSVGHTPAVSARGPDVLLVRRCGAGLSLPELKEHRSDRLGAQFVFGILPITSLYLQHGTDCLIEESALEFFRKQALDIALIEQKDIPRWAGRWRTGRIVEFSATDFSVYAYDLFFARRAVISGNLQIRYFDAQGQVVGLRTAPISDAEFLLQAQASRLVRNANRALDKAFKTVFDGVPRVPTLGFQQSELQNKPLESSISLTIPPPRILAVPNFGPELAASYGTPGFVDVPEHSIARLVQRALHAAVPEYSVASLQHGSIRAPRTWMLGSAVKALSFAEEPESMSGKQGLRMKIEFLLSEGPVALHQGSCLVWQPIPRAFDGALVIALEQGAAAAVRSFLAGAPNEAGSESQRVRCSAR